MGNESRRSTACRAPPRLMPSAGCPRNATNRDEGRREQSPGSSVGPGSFDKGGLEER
jgi:hypothetical protein